MINNEEELDGMETCPWIVFERGYGRARRCDRYDTYTPCRL